MGAYINPEDITKEDWLTDNATEYLTIAEAEKAAKDSEGMIVVLLDNGPFTAAGIVFSDDELVAFTHHDDMRPKRFFVATVPDLMHVCPELRHFL
ncbi:hypothetical protein KAR91_50275 [Candidatus Pacearchaeota archaeon]|nr:hypothetical protein [Candidatus Pacearchaeota archaeon]